MKQRRERKNRTEKRRNGNKGIKNKIMQEKRDCEMEKKEKR